MRAPPVRAMAAHSSSRASALSYLFCLGVLALALTCFVEFAYFPSKKQLEDHQVLLQQLQDTVSALHFEDQQLRRRIAELEAEPVEEQLSQIAAAAGDGGRDARPRPTKQAKKDKVKAGVPASTTAELPQGQAASATAAATDGSGNAAAAGSKFLGSLLVPSPPPATSPRAPAGKKKKPRWREDFACGPSVLGDDGSPSAECDPASDNPCCAQSGWCGSTAEHCECAGCVDFRPSGSAGPTKDYDMSSSKHIALVVPFRDREAHLERFRERIKSHVQAWNAKGIRHNWTVYVVEQYDNELFNRGYLFNAGFRSALEQAKLTGRPYDCVVMHDIDIIPQAVVDYGWCQWPNQLSGEIECHSWSAPYPDNVGGVVSLSPAHWQKINGFSNDYEGWGGEDDDLYHRLRQNALLKGNCHTWCKNKPTVPMVRRPALGQGRFNCLHDGDHTPRQRAPDDAPMWKRLNDMKGGSKRWQSDGLGDLQVHEATGRLEYRSCKECVAPEDPTPRERLFNEQWIRVSQKPLAAKSIAVVLPSTPGCPEQRVLLERVPDGLDGLRAALPSLFDTCGLSRAKAAAASFALLDLTLGQVLLVGQGAGAVIPDSSLPALQKGGGDREQQRVKDEAHRLAASHLMQSQRLLRWIRNLPAQHHAEILVLVDTPLAEVRQQFHLEGRRVPVVQPVCISQVKFDSSRKFRVVPNTRWCGDAGWSSGEWFYMLRSSETVKQDKLVPFCVASENSKYTYRFENSAAGCIGKHDSSGTFWEHSQTMYTTKDAEGEDMCVGYISAGPNTRWTIQKAAMCVADGASHSFSFKAMSPDHYSAPLARACLLPLAGAGAVRLASGQACGQDSRDHGLWLLSGRQAASDFHLCSAQGRREGDRAARPDLVRVFWGDVCDRSGSTTWDSTGQRIEWAISKEPLAFAPDSATGPSRCLCEMELAGGALGYSWVDGSCKQKELCIKFLSSADMLRFASLIDDVS